MAELLCLELSNKPVKHHLQEWLDAVQQLHALGEWSRARLLLNTVLQARDDCVEAHVLLVQTLLHLGEPQWPKALQEARHAVATCCHRDNASAADQARVQLMLGLALGSVARMTVLPQAERSKHRSEARTVLQQAAQQPGSHRVASLYALALINAEGGHYDLAVACAQEALEAAEAADAQQHAVGGPAAAGVPSAPIVALLALLLSARQQLQPALSVVEAGLSSLPSSERCDSHASLFSSSSSRRLPHCYDVMLHRVKAQLLLALSSANEALAVLGSARQRLSAARRALGSRQDAAAAVALLREQEAQVWRDLALVYASQQQSSDAQLCVQKMQQLEPHSAASYHAVGSVAAACKDTVGAKQAYKAALALDAMHAPALLSLGALLRRQGDEHDLSVAVGLLTDALRYEPHSHVGWFNLGMARKAQGHSEEGEKHLFTAVTLAAAAPVLSYSDLPLGI
ncbi:hypothetical protein OEZ86_005707 [Tetradesmus obliquus]|nr:hypothetical protein OEZ86_005707 [Tetradesmus obliquus]